MVATLERDGVSYIMPQTSLAWVLAGRELPPDKKVNTVDGDVKNLRLDNLILVGKEVKRSHAEYTGYCRSRCAIEELGLEYLRTCFDVDLESGLVVWKHRPREHFSDDHSYKMYAKKYPGTPLRVPLQSNQKIIAQFSVKDKKYVISAHYLVWYFAGKTVTGDNVLDHINRNGQDNRLANLRECSKIDNARNCSVAKNNKTGATGVLPHKGRWRAQISLGTFDTFEEAVAARRKAEIDIYGAYAPDATTDPAFLSRTAGTLAGLI